MAPSTAADDDAFTIVSICGEPGTLHIYSSRDSAPRHVRTAIHVGKPHAAALTSTTLHGLSKTVNATAPSLHTHALLPGPGPSSRRSSPGESLSVLAVSPSHTYVAAAGPTAHVFVWHAATGHLFSSFSSVLHAITALAFSDDEDLLLVALADAQVLVYNLPSLADLSRDIHQPVLPVASLVGHHLPVTTIAPGYAGAAARVLTASPDRSVKIWHLFSQTCLASVLFDTPPTHAALSSDEAHAAVSLSDGSVALFAPQQLAFGSSEAIKPSQLIPSPVSSSPAFSATTLAFSPNGARLVVGYSDGLIRVYDVPSHSLIHTYAKHSTTAAVTFVSTLPTLPKAPTEALPTLSRSAPLNNAATLEPPFHHPHGKALEDVALEMIDAAQAVAFPDENILATEVEPTSGKTQKMWTRSDVVVDELIRENRFLRARNRKLEAAGRLIVEKVKRLQKS